MHCLGSCLVLVGCMLLAGESSAFTQHSLTIHSRYANTKKWSQQPYTQQHTTALCLARKGTDTTKTSTKGVYSRPSAAIERGSGFFIPGLEGPRVRLVFGVVVLVLVTLNHVLSSQLSTVAFAEGIAGLYAILLLLQAAIEFGKQGRVVGVTLDTKNENVASSSSVLSQTWSTDVSDDDYADRVQWAVASYLSLTPATQMMLLDRKNGIVYRLGSSATPTTILPQDEMAGVQAAFSALDGAKSGRVSLPSTHPTVTFLIVEQDDNRCVVLQRISDDACWMMTSNQLLPAFTKQDLKWLGQLAAYVA